MYCIGVAIGGTVTDCKAGCAVPDRPVRGLGPAYATHEARAGHTVRCREYRRPITGRRIETEILRDGDEPLHDMVLTVAGQL